MKVVVTGGGSGTGAAALQNGAADIAQMSRSLDSVERAKLESRGVPVEEIVVARDGIAVLVHESNPCGCFTLTEVKKIFTGKQEHWGGALRDSSGNRIVLCGRESGSGAQRIFTERVLKGESFAGRIATLPGTASVVSAAREDSLAIGYGGIACARGVKICSLKTTASSAATLPTREMVLGNTYPLARDLYWYTTNATNPILAELIAFAMSEEGKQIIEQARYLVEREHAP